MTTTTTKRKPVPMPRVSRLADNIRATYLQATETERHAGLHWYDAANVHARYLADSHGVSIGRAAGVIAVLSPRVPWSRNVAMAYEIFATGTTGGLSANVVKAQRLALGAHPDDVVSGDKVSSFYANILDPSGHEITIDRHAFDIAQGRRTDDKTRAVLSNKGHYARYAQAYQLVADELGIGACQLQAITWVAWRRIHGVNA